MIRPPRSQAILQPAWQRVESLEQMDQSMPDQTQATAEDIPMEQPGQAGVVEAFQVRTKLVIGYAFQKAGGEKLLPSRPDGGEARPPAGGLLQIGKAARPAVAIGVQQRLQRQRVSARLLHERHALADWVVQAICSERAYSTGLSKEVLLY
jgi:hypothetical protein